MAQCTATSKRTGERCRAQAVAGSEVCRTHGAAGGRPIKHGRYSKHLPKRLASRYRQLASDESLLQAQEHLALLETLLGERLGKLGETSQAELWGQAIEVYRGTRSAMSDGKAAETMSGLELLGNILENGLGQAKAESDIRALIQESVPVRKVELQRLYAEETAVTAKQVQALLAAVLDAINRFVDDPEAKRRVGEELLRLAG